MQKPMELFAAYEHNKLPMEGGGYILSVFYDNKTNTPYTKYELVAYNNVKDIRYVSEGLWFKSDGYKLYVLIEPASYPERFQEPSLRQRGKEIPYKFADLEIFSVGSQNHRIMVSKNPMFSFSSFSIVKSSGDDFSVFFRPSEDIKESMIHFLGNCMKNDIGASAVDGKKIAKYIMKVVENIKFKQY